MNLVHSNVPSLTWIARHLDNESYGSTSDNDKIKTKKGRCNYKLEGTQRLHTAACGLLEGS